jgi:hypothetical protein
MKNRLPNTFVFTSLIFAGLPSLSFGDVYTELLVSTSSPFLDGQNNAGLDSASASSGFLWDRRLSDTGPTLSTSTAADASFDINNVDRIMSTAIGGTDTYFSYYGPGVPRMIISPSANGTGAGSFSASLDLGANFLTAETGYEVTRSYIEMFDFGLNKSDPPLAFATMDFQVYVNSGTGPTLVTDAANLSYEFWNTDDTSLGNISYLGGGTFRFTGEGTMTTGEGIRIYGLFNGSEVTPVQKVDFFNQQTSILDAVGFRAGREITTIPEAGSFALLGAGAVLAGSRRKR